MAYDCFLKIDEFKGGSTDEAHKEWIDVISFSHGVSQTFEGVTPSARCDHDTFTIRKRMDRSTPNLNFYCSMGLKVNLTLVLNRATEDKKTYMEYKMTDAFISNYRVIGEAKENDAFPTEEVSFRYKKIDWTFNDLDLGGAYPHNWDLAANTGS